MTEWPIEEQYGHAGCRVTISYEQDGDEFANPRQVDNLGVMLANGHRNYSLGDAHLEGKHSPYDDADRATRHFLDRFRGSVALDTTSRWLRIFYGATVVKPLYLLDHSGISMSTGPFMSDPGGWDSGVVGLIFDDPGQHEDFGNPDPARVEEILNQEVKYYDAYLQGSVLFWTVEALEDGACGHTDCDEHQEWDIVEDGQCGGYLFAEKEDLEHIRAEANAVADSYADEHTAA